MGMIKEFKEFAVRGNVIDMAVGIISGDALPALHVGNLIGNGPRNCVYW